MSNLFNIDIRKHMPSLMRHKRNPFAAIQSELDKAMHDFHGWLDSPHVAQEKLDMMTLYPSIDIVEDNENFKIEAEMPGMGPEDIKVSMENGLLKITGEKEVSRQDTEKDYRMREIAYGTYERTMSLPDYVDSSRIKATFKKGMLWITLPKKSGMQGDKREVKVEAAEPTPP